MEIKNQIIKPAVSVVAMGETSNHMAAVVAGESPNLTEETSNHWAIVPYAGAKIEDYADIKSCHQVIFILFFFLKLKMIWTVFVLPIYRDLLWY